MSRRVACVLALAAVALGLRSYQLGLANLHYDEAFHVYAAKGILETGEPALPSGKLYTRSPWVTAMGVASIRLFGLSEASVRVPSVIVSTLAVAASYWIFGALFGWRVATVAAALIAISPFCISLARLFRYYAVLQLTHVVSLGCLLYVFGKPQRIDYASPLESIVAALRGARGLVALVVALGCAYLMYVDNRLSLMVWPAVLAMIAIRAAHTWRTGGRAALLASSDFAVLALAAIGGLVVLVASPDTFKAIYRGIYRVDDWARHRIDDHFYYFRLLSADYRLWPLLFGVGAYRLIRRHPWTGLAVVAEIVLALVLMSFVFSFKVDRYLGFLYPCLLLVFGTGLLAVADWVAAWVKRFGIAESAKQQSWLSAGLVVGSLILSPALARSFSAVQSDAGLYEGLASTRIDHALTRLGKQRVRNGIVITREGLLTSYYLGRLVDYVIVLEEGENGTEGVPRQHYSGAGKILTLEELRQLIETSSKEIFILAEATHWNNSDVVDAAFRAYVQNGLDDVASDDTGTIAVYVRPPRP